MDGDCKHEIDAIEVQNVRGCREATDAVDDQARDPEMGILPEGINNRRE